MKRPKYSEEERALEQIRATQQLLLKREKESEENRQRLVRQRREQERMLPPLEEVQVRARRKQHELCVSRGKCVNILRVQNPSMPLLLLLGATACSLVWWASH